MPKNKRDEGRPLLSKAFFILCIAIGFTLVSVAAYIWYSSQSRISEPLTIANQVTESKADKPRVAGLTPPAHSTSKPKVAIVIDDMGGDMKALRDILNMDARITLSVLPYLQYSKDVAIAARRKDREVLLHLPMEPKDTTINDPGEGALFTKMSESEIVDTVLKDIEAVPYIAGINNHMGSKFTENNRLMKVVLNVAKDKGLFFLDSKTTNKSAAYDLAKELGLKAASRQVFLDNDYEDEEYIRKQILKLLETAKERGAAIAIGHPHFKTIKVLGEMIPRLNQDVEIVAVGSLIDSINE